VKKFNFRINQKGNPNGKNSSLEEPRITSKKLHYGWIVASAGIGINLALGVIYSSSIFQLILI